MKLPKTFLAKYRRFQDRVKIIDYEPENGFLIYIKEGYTDSLNPGRHLIIEPNLKLALEAFSRITKDVK